MRALLASLLLLTLAFAGCASNGGGGGEDDVSETGTATGSGTATKSGTTSVSQTGSSSATGTGAPGKNGAPTGSISAVVNGTSVAFQLTGSDPDGDNLTWTLDFGDEADSNGTGLPATVNHTYSAAGNFTAVYVLSDGVGNGTYNVSVQVQGAGVAAGPIQTFEGSWPVPGGACGASYPVWPVGEGADGVAWLELQIDPATFGRTYTSTFTYEDPTGIIAAIAMEFYDSAGDVLDGGYFEFSPVTSATGTVPAGAAYAVFFDCFTGGATSVTYAA